MSLFFNKEGLKNLWNKIWRSNSGIVLYQDKKTSFPNSDYAIATFPISLSQSAFNFKMLRINWITSQDFAESCIICDPKPRKKFRLQNWRCGGDNTNTSYFYYIWNTCRITNDGMQIEATDYEGYLRFGNATITKTIAWHAYITDVIGYYDYC